MSSVADVSSLFQSAFDDNVIGEDALNSLQVVDLGNKIADALGVPAEDFEQSEVVLVSVKTDDSGSIRFAGNSAAVRDGHNLIIESLVASKQQDNMLFLSQLLNGDLICPYVPIDHAERLTKKNYSPDRGTPLYDETVAFLGTVLAKAQEFADHGVPCRTISLLITDGADMHSTRHNAGNVKKIVDDMLRQENHLVAAMGIRDDDGVDYELVFRAMGILPQWILTPQSNPTEIRKACRTFSQSAVRASQSAAGFSQQAIGGFGG
ncbi:MAG: hypothetical protein HQ567_28405 [Candidatus Nealsonbacteria bacterium]|nr:hypothetical protein [Candidatus Nealsonbacteria bacterium]